MRPGLRGYLVALAVGPAMAGCGGTSPPSALAPLSAAEPVGRETCSTCHPEETARWTGSHHDRAMQPAAAGTVLGAFDGRQVSHAGVASTFSRDAEGFYVRTDGPNGTLRDYKIAYTFGVDPLQQYLIETTPGRYQALSLFWDARPTAEGGQQWRHLHPDEAVDYRDPLHWTGVYQNWNYMCAECHSTGVRRGYDIAEGRFRTTWSEINVSCEACHGPGSRHVEWARSGRRETPDLGLTVSLRDPDGGEWTFSDTTGIARRSRPRSSQAELETCALCHSRRAPLVDGYRYGRPLADTHRVTLLENGMYYPDGQILEEDYEYGSFLQSAMHRAGVTCTDCHDPHAAGKQPLDDGACARCHLPSRFATREHHRHRPGTPAASCIGCHMPSRTYMVVDRRHDHSFRIPRPDLSVKIGTPNVCTDCHRDRDAPWAAGVTARWYPNGRGGSFHYGEALQAGRTWAADRAPLLRRVTSDPAMPAIVRASALSLLGRQVSPEDVPEIERSLKDPDPIVRQAGLAALELFPPDERWNRARTLISDPIRSVRLEAAWLLADLPPSAQGAPGDPHLEAAFAEYLATQRSSADRPESWLNQGAFQSRRGDNREAEKDYRTALARQPWFIPAYVNLADLYRIEKREAEGEELLREALRRDPGSAEVHYALGLLLVRRGRSEEAIGELRLSAAKGSEPRYPYTMGVALSSLGRDGEAFRTLEETYRRFPGYRDALLALTTLYRDHGSRPQAIEYARRLTVLSPSDPAAKELLSELEEKR